MLHNKRFYGLLLAKIIPEDEINETVYIIHLCIQRMILIQIY